MTVSEMIIQKNIAVYARYSSDLQNPTSVDDQIRICHKHINETYKNPSITYFKDEAISGATLERPGIQRLLHAVKFGRVDIVIAEGLDRLSRSLKDIATIHELLSYYDASIWTIHEGAITEMHVAFKGTMNALFLKDMKQKVRRGQSARVEAGFSASSCPYGYRVVRGVVDAKGRNVNGIREIDDEKAKVAIRIFNAFADGKRIPSIIDELNSENIPAPSGGLWKRTSLLGSPEKHEGILRNEIYIGNLVYNRTRGVRDPSTHKMRYVRNPEKEWTRTHVPDLRIIENKLWDKVQEIDKQRRDARGQNKNARKIKKPRILNSHNQKALTGWVKCGWCNGLKSVANDSRYICSTHRYAKQCSNSRGTKEPLLLEKTLSRLVERIKTGPDFRDQLIHAFAKELERSKEMEEKAADLRQRIGRLISLAEYGAAQDDIAERIQALKNELEEALYNIMVAPPPNIPDEGEIRHIFYAEINRLFLLKNIEALRILFTHVLKEIVLTPVIGQRSGETIIITLREEGWPDLWKLITTNP